MRKDCSVSREVLVTVRKVTLWPLLCRALGAGARVCPLSRAEAGSCVGNAGNPPSLPFAAREAGANTVREPPLQEGAQLVWTPCGEEEERMCLSQCPQLLKSEVISQAGYKPGCSDSAQTVRVSFDEWGRQPTDLPTLSVRMI